MTDLETRPTSSPRRGPSSWSVAISVFFITFGAFGIVGPLIGAVLAYFYHGDFNQGLLEFVTTDPIGHEDLKMPWMIMQACATFIGLALIPPLFWKSLRHKPVFSLFGTTKLEPTYFLFIIGIVIFFYGPNSVVIDWNSHINLPGNFGTWAKDLEDRAAELTKYLTSFSNVGQYIAGVIVIAILPAIGEELVFRGILQTELQKGSGNPHVGIWLSAILFSALHLQFYGFFPRVLLGAVFGYLYYWSGSLTLSMFAHFVNNFLAVTAIYAGMTEMPGMEIENPTSMPWYIVVSFTALFAASIYLFKRQFQLTNDLRA